MTLAFSPKPLNPADNRENGNRPYHRVMEELLDLFVPVCVPQRSRECTQSPAGLATVYSQLTNFSPSARGRPGPSQVVLPFVFRGSIRASDWNRGGPASAGTRGHRLF
jgi:hypothetical protein